MPLEDSDDSFGELDELTESWAQRLTVKNLALAERYLNRISPSSSLSRMMSSF
jgi:hypothetical protein